MDQMDHPAVGPDPKGEATKDPIETTTMPGAHLAFDLAYEPEGRISPYQPYPLTPPSDPAAATGEPR